MKKLSNRVYLFSNVILIIAEFIILMLVKKGVIRSDYWLEVGLNYFLYLSFLGLESMLLYLSFKIDDEENQKSLLISQLVIFPIIFIGMLYKLTVFYDW
jgi:hypothetical protein